MSVADDCLLPLKAGLKLEAKRLAEMKRLKKEARADGGGGKTTAEKLDAAAMAEAMRASRQKN